MDLGNVSGEIVPEKPRFRSKVGELRQFWGFPPGFGEKLGKIWGA